MYCQNCSDKCPCYCCIKNKEITTVPKIQDLSWFGDKTIEDVACCLQPQISQTKIPEVTILSWVGESKPDESNRRFAYKPQPNEWIFIADENETKIFNTPVDLRYGVNALYTYMYNVTGTITFNNATFGDPAVGLRKQGWFKYHS